MKSRWITIPGRTGSVILVVGLALALLSLIPIAPTGMFNAMGGFDLKPGKYRAFPYTRVYSPQIGARITVTSNNSVQLYLLATHALELSDWAESWIRENFPDLDETQIWSEMDNVSVLHNFLQAHEGTLLLNKTVNGEYSIDCFPLEVTNVTIVVPNPSLMWAKGKIYLTEIATLVPRERVVPPAKVLIASGMVLTLPWTVKKMKREEKEYKGS